MSSLRCCNRVCEENLSNGYCCRDCQIGEGERRLNKADNEIKEKKKELEVALKEVIELKTAKKNREKRLLLVESMKKKYERMKAEEESIKQETMSLTKKLNGRVEKYKASREIVIRKMTICLRRKLKEGQNHRKMLVSCKYREKLMGLRLIWFKKLKKLFPLKSLNGFEDQFYLFNDRFRLPFDKDKFNKFEFNEEYYNGLGYLVLLVNTFSQIFDIKLPYEMVYAGIKSYVVCKRDNRTIELPLYLPPFYGSLDDEQKRKSKSHFMTGFMLFNDNIVALMTGFGIYVSGKRLYDFRYNLISLYSSHYEKHIFSENQFSRELEYSITPRMYYNVRTCCKENPMSEYGIIPVIKYMEELGSFDSCYLIIDKRKEAIDLLSGDKIITRGVNFPLGFKGNKTFLVNFLDLK